jgi:hypothetical protein
VQEVYDILSKEYTTAYIGGLRQLVQGACDSLRDETYDSLCKGHTAACARDIRQLV